MFSYLSFLSFKSISDNYFLQVDTYVHHLAHDINSVRSKYCFDSEICLVFVIL